jgi:hypothetical protein
MDKQEKLNRQRKLQLATRVEKDMEELILFLFNAGHAAELIWVKVKQAYPFVKIPPDFIINTLRKKGNLEQHSRVNLIAPEDFSTYPADPSWRLLQKKTHLAPRSKNHPMTVGDYHE